MFHSVACPLCGHVQKMRESLAYRISGENRHPFPCRQCDARLEGVMRDGRMLVVRSGDHHEARRMMDEWL